MLVDIDVFEAIDIICALGICMDETEKLAEKNPDIAKRLLMKNTEWLRLSKMLTDHFQIGK